MIDRVLIATALATHFVLAAAFVLTEGPGTSDVVLKLTATHGVHRSDLPILPVWAIGTVALVALWWRRTDQRDD